MATGTTPAVRTCGSRGVGRPDPCPLEALPLLEPLSLPAGRLFVLYSMSTTPGDASTLTCAFLKLWYSLPGAPSDRRQGSRNEASILGTCGCLARLPLSFPEARPSPRSGEHTTTEK